jgi:hypothetical protein
VEVAEVVKPKRGIAKPSFEYKSNFFSLSWHVTPIFILYGKQATTKR